ncbi:uncharacterized protein LOC132730543 isoform X2 [Ruditapes philippinarum]|uniref:uncharacterized protein LOC132730543 isoform X2 n=1 Tax=Ruditapes philippinarum TaxID=129788 RepID=UPI00295ACF81|nr:uncharacterized protein LOC132730543 isoform X2 [Ruditapes philippinarum]
MIAGKMDTATILFIFTCFLLVHQTFGAHGSVMCRQCKNVKGPGDCHQFKLHCGHGEVCVTDVFKMADGTHSFNYGCKHEGETCGHHHHASPDLVGKRRRGKRNEGTHVCQECCHATGCDLHTCTKYIDHGATSVPAQITTDNGCRDYETATFRCAEFDKYNFCSDQSSVAYAIAHEKCAKHCGFCSPSGNLSPVTAAPTTQRPVVIVTDSVDITPAIVNVDVTSGSADCVDSDQQTLPCADIERYGFCSPDSGAGFSLAKTTCKKTCKLC